MRVPGRGGGGSGKYRQRVSAVVRKWRCARSHRPDERAGAEAEMPAHMRALIAHCDWMEYAMHAIGLALGSVACGEVGVVCF